MRSMIRKLVPFPIRSAIAWRRASTANRNGSLWCPVCEHSVAQFLPHGNPPKADILCPICRSKACHRLAWAWFRQNSNMFRSGGAFVHIAPEVQLGKYLSRRCRKAKMKYLHGDITDSQHPLDIMNLRLSSNSVDVLFACHVLNMVSDDVVALKEIYRVVKPGGVAILPVPIHSDVSQTIEAAADSPQTDRQTLFNDSLMFRKYAGDDYLQRLTSIGFQPAIFRPTDVVEQNHSNWSLCNEWVQTAMKSEIDS